MPKLTHNIANIITGNNKSSIDKDVSELIDLIANEVEKRLERKQMVNDIIKNSSAILKGNTDSKGNNSSRSDSVAYDMNSIK
jgi:hypothetical protein